jgi:hypothetical protein
MMKSSKASPPDQQTLPAQYRRIRRQLAQLGWLALGSLVERTRPGQGGPRYQWSRRVAGKTVTVALSAEQFRWLKSAITNQRKARDLLRRLQQLSLKFMWKHLPTAPRRKSLSNKTLGLN